MSPSPGLDPAVARDGGHTRPHGEAVQRVAPRLPTPPPAARDASGGTLPDDLLAEHLQRLTAFALVAGGLWGIGLLMDAVVFPLAIGAPVRPTSLAINALGVLGAIGTYVWVRFSKRPPRAKSDAGMWLMLLNAADIALLETWAVDPTHAMMGHLSWTAIVILLSAMIVPTTPKKMLIFGLAAASMSPIGVWLAYLRGVDTPSAFHTLLMYMPTYSCAVAAVVPARMFQGVTRRLREARDLGSYELVERLGEGGMGEVWRARHRLLARPAAIKLVRPAMLAGGDEGDARLAIKRFEAEAQATAALTSPHTIRLFDFGATDDGRFYYVMELLEGRDMASLVEESGPLPAARVVYLLRQICHSLAEAHSQGMVHRDIKPANIFVCHMGLDYDVVKVLDFGLVQKARRDPAQDLTASMASLASLAGVAGTPAFMAPELVTDPDHVDHRADIYAVGCVAHFLLTGEHVFPSRTPMQALVDHVSTPPPRASARASADVPGWLDDLILACLAKAPSDRPRSIAEVLQRMVMLEGTPGWNAAAARDWWQRRQAGEPARSASLNATRPASISPMAGTP